MTGSVTTFDDRRGIGEIAGDDGGVYLFHCTVIADGCAAFGQQVHNAAIEGLRPVAKVITVADAMAAFAAL